MALPDIVDSRWGRRRATNGLRIVRKTRNMRLVAVDDDTTRLLDVYIEKLGLQTSALMVTCDRAVYAGWLGRPVPSSYGGAYTFLRRHGLHAILINTARIDLDQPRALEVVVAEELIHMRDWLDGDRRRHAHHGFDRIAHRVAALTGASLEEIRSALRPVKRLPPKYLYACPGCGRQVPRRKRGTWSCGHCAPRFDERFVLRLVETP